MKDTGVCRPHLVTCDAIPTNVELVGGSMYTWFSVSFIVFSTSSTQKFKHLFIWSYYSI